MFVFETEEECQDRMTYLIAKKDLEVEPRDTSATGLSKINPFLSSSFQGDEKSRQIDTEILAHIPTQILPDTFMCSYICTYAYVYRIFHTFYYALLLYIYCIHNLRNSNF